MRGVIYCGSVCRMFWLVSVGGQGFALSCCVSDGLSFFFVASVWVRGFSLIMFLAVVFLWCWLVVGFCGLSKHIYLGFVVMIF